MAQPNASPNRALYEAPVESGGETRLVLTPGLIFTGLWQGRKLGFTIIALCLALAMAYIVFLHRPVYESTAVIEPPISSGPQLSGASQVLASFAGIEAGSASQQFTKYLQVIDSIRFAQRMDQDHHVMQILNGGWDPVNHRWIPPSGFVEDLKARLKAALGMRGWSPPDATSLALSLRGMTSISLVPGKSPLDLRSQVFAVSVRAKSPELAYNLLNWSLRATDDLVREDQLARTTNRIAYLKAQIDSTQEVYLRGSLQQILMAQEETLMTLHADKYYAVDLIDAPNYSPLPVGTSSMTVLMTAVLGGFAFYGLIVVFLLMRRLRAPRPVESLRKPFPNPIGSAVGRLRMALR